MDFCITMPGIDPDTRLQQSLGWSAVPQRLVRLLRRDPKEVLLTQRAAGGRLRHLDHVLSQA